MDAILGSECSNNGLKSYLRMTIQYNINLQDKMKINTHILRITLYSVQTFYLAAILDAMLIFFKLILGMGFNRQLHLYVLTAKCGK